MDVIIIVMNLILIGYLLKYLKLLKETDRIALNNIVVYITMPATIFLTIMTKVSSSDLFEFLKLPFAIIITDLICGILAYFVGKSFLKLNNKSLGGFILVCMLGNTGFLGYPIAYGLYGDDGLARAIFCDMGGVFATMLFGTYVGIKFGKNSGNILKELLRFPPLITGIFTIILVFFGVELDYFPSFIIKTLEYLSSATIPLIMLSLGLSLSPSAAKFGIFYGMLVSLFRFGVSPATAYSLSEVFLISGLEKKVLIIESAMPSALMTLVLSTLYELDVKLVASCCFITTVLSLAVIPIIQYLKF
ncbi:AEC family transporter [Methanotorris igneus]|uniref:Auxin Efflux Carrier n=1 Tax=Methanotorris igneus (strain DSM 5666 / JCM 11834 / Kol 5) TaxID=880724 RepID=F6BCW2_METIK|nr:AEC family transporter [Methanotorris igneus]AEF96323.1 Auxin Efflux Carrier [Methanotorris igneus Kol 5]